MVCLEGILAVIGGFCLHLTIGSGYTAGNMATYILSYLRFIGIDAAIKDTIWIFAMIKFGQGLLMSVGGVLERKIGPRKTSFLGSIIASSGVAFTYFTVNVSLILIIVTYGLMFGIGISILYVSPLITAMKWFPNHKGLVNGLIVAGSGFGFLIFTEVQTHFLNPENAKADNKGFFNDRNLLEKVPKVFLLLAATYSSVQLISCAVLKVPQSKNEEKEEKQLSVEAGNVKKDYSPLEMLKCRQFYMLWFTFCFNQPIIVYLPAMYKVYGQTFIDDDNYMATIGAVSAIFNSIGRITWGWILDKTNYKSCMLTLTLTVGGLVATLSLTQYGGKAMYTIWVWAIFFVSSGNFALMPTCTANNFGLKNASINYGLVFSNTIISAPLEALLTQFLTPIIGWNGIFAVIAICSFTSTIITLFFRPIQ